MKECPHCGKKYRDDDYYCKLDNYPLKKIEGSPRLYSDELYDASVKRDIQNSPKVKISCPYCHSTDTTKISGISKVGLLAIFGIFAASKVGKQWHCNKCKSDF